MHSILKHKRFKEFISQIGFFGILFLIYALNKHDNTIYWYDGAFFLFYIAVALLIGYVLIPRFFYRKKIWMFWLLIIVTLVFVFLLEEYVLEPFLVGGDRGKYVSNILYTLLGIIPILFMMVGFKLAWDSKQKQRELENLQVVIKDSELRYLKSQINPHFLFNNLNNLYSYAIENSEKTPSIILELSSVLRYMLYDCREDFVPLAKDIEHLKNFTALNELQIEERGNVTFNSEVTSEDFCIAPLILTVFVENAFKHSTASQSDNIEIAIETRVDSEGLLLFSCVNSFLENSNNENLSKGIGLENVKKRLDILYPNAYQLNIDTTSQMYRVALSLQLRSNNNLC